MVEKWVGRMAAWMAETLERLGLMKVGWRVRMSEAMTVVWKARRRVGWTASMKDHLMACLMVGRKVG